MRCNESSEIYVSNMQSLNVLNYSVPLIPGYEDIWIILAYIDL